MGSNSHQASNEGGSALNPFCCNTNMCNNDSNVVSSADGQNGAQRKNGYRKNTHQSNGSNKMPAAPSQQSNEHGGGNIE